MCFEGYPIGCSSEKPGILGPAEILNLEEMLRKDANKYGVVGSEYILRVHQEIKGRLHIYVRPSDRNGTTLDFWLDGNNLTLIC